LRRNIHPDSQAHNPFPSKPCSRPRSPVSPPNGLSTATKGGIGGGIAGILLLALGDAWVFFTRQKRDRSLHTDINDDLPEYEDAVKTQHTYGGIDSHAELPAGPATHELAASRPMSALPAGRVTHELPM
jgi:hypothetical protein